MAIYKQNGFRTKQMTLAKGNKPLFEILKDYDVVDDTTDLQKYKEQTATYIIVGEMKPNEQGQYIRSNSNVISRDYAFLDYDEIDISNADFINLVADKLQGYEYLLYPTIRHTEGKPRYRLVLPLERPANDKEYKSTIQSIANLIGLKNDSSSATFSQLQGTPVVRKSQEENYKKNMIHITGKKFPVSEEKGIDSGKVNSLKLQSADCINHDTALIYFSNFVDRNKEELRDYDKAFNQIAVIAKSVQTGEIKYETAYECVRILASINLTTENLEEDVKDWESENIEKLNREINNTELRTKGTFKSAYISYMVTDCNGNTLEIEKDEDGKIIKSLDNYSKMVRSVIPIAYNDYTKEVEIIEKGKIKTADNEEFASIRLLVERKFKITIPKKDVTDVVLLASKEQTYNPVQDIIKKVKWDGVPRAETLLIDFLGVDDNIYTREVSKKILLASVYRNFETNVKFDEMVVLFGKQGLGKSTLLERLAFGKYYLSLTDKIDSKDTNQLTLSKWIVEHEELASMQKTSSNSMKAWLSSHNDTYRIPYDRYAKTFPRTFVNFGTTNQDSFLKDYTGNRRYLILECDKDRVKKLIWETDDNYFYQLWAEVFEMYLRKESIVISEATTEYMQDKSKGHIIKDEITEFLSELLEVMLPEDWEEILFEERAVKTNKYDLGMYLKDIIRKGVSEYFKYDKKEKIKDITSDEVVAFIKIFCVDDKSSDRKLRLKASNFFSGLEEWKKSENVKRYGKRKNGYIRL